MNNVIHLTEERMAQLQSGKPITIEPPKLKQWEHAGGDFYVDSTGDIRRVPSSSEARKFGSERKTLEAAEKASDVMRTHNRLLAYVEEFGGNWKADWEDMGQKKWFVYYTHECNFTDWAISYTGTMQAAGAVYMSKDCAEELIKKLKSGEVVL